MRVAAARARAGHMVKIEIEVDTIAQLQEALEEPIDAVLLDNMAPAVLAEAVALVNGRVTTEASGGVTLENVAEIARSGVDLISIGTHHPQRAGARSLARNRSAVEHQRKSDDGADDGNQRGDDVAGDAG